MSQKGWTNQATQQAFHLVIEEWDRGALEVLPLLAKNSLDLAQRIHDSFRKSFTLIRSPFLRHACLDSLESVDFRQVADRLLAMLARQREHLARKGGEQP